MSKTINAQVLQVVKTSAEWQAESKIISEGLLCIETTTDGKVLAKVGDGTKAYSALPYLSDGSFNIANYYTSSETDTAISNAVSALGTIFTFKGIKTTKSELPTTNNKAGDVWFVGTAASGDDSYEEYLWTDSNKWEFIGERQVETDLSDYATTESVETHTSNKSNPHGVTKAQVGLGNVENKSSATIRGEITKENVTTALGYTPPQQDTTYSAVVAGSSTAGLMTGADKSRLDAMEDGAQANQNAVSKITVGSTSITAASPTDEVKFVAGSNATVTANATNKTVTINAAYDNATTSKSGLMSAEDKTTLDTVAADYIKSTDTLILQCSL